MLLFHVTRHFHAVPRPSRSSTATLFFRMSSSSFNFKLSTFNSASLTPFPATLTSYLQPAEKPATLSLAFATLASRIKHKSCVCHSYKKHPGWGIPLFSANSVPSALKSTRALSPTDPSDANQRPLIHPEARRVHPQRRRPTAPLSPLVTILDALDAASSLSPVFATLTKNTRGGVPPSPSANSVHSALNSTRALSPDNPFVVTSPAPPPKFCLPFNFQLSTVNLLPLLAVGCKLSTVSFPVPLYPVTVLELDCGLEFDPARDEDFFAALPPKPAVCLIESRAENAEPFLIRTQDLRRLQRLLGPADPASKRLNLRELASGIRYRLTGSALEQIFTYYQHAKHLFPQRYRKLTRLRPPAVLKISLRNAYPRCYVTRRIAVDETGAPTAGAYYGPFPSRKSALAFSEQALDLFKVRRCQIKIRRDPTFPGCIYSEMKMCLAPCFAGCSKEEYDAEVQRLVQFLDTNGNSLRAAIEDDRERASADLDFERAAQLHKRVEKVDAAL